ncbi:MAG TPA: hypothetical protein DEO88_14285 [Syntrophobacteraceae bacterium]|nr:hypothetical protein [Syntrophobacteraceae bacterium]
MAEDNLREALGPLLRRILEKHPAFSANPLGDWEELVGELIAHHCQPKSLKNGILRFVVVDSHWKHHLHMHQEALLAKINEGRSEPLATKLVFSVGEMPASAPPLNPNHKLIEKLEAKARRGRKKKPVLRELSAEEKQLLQSITDPELRRACMRLLRRVHDDASPR